MYNPYFNGYNNGYMERLQTPQQTNQLIRVNGIEGARAYPMQPNSSVALFDGNDDIVYVKISDGGSFSTIRQFKMTEILENSKPNVEYVTRAEFDELKGMITNAKHTISKSTK